MIRRIGNGSTVDIWKDLWVMDGGRFITSTAVKGIKHVSGLLNATTMEWKVELITNLFN